MAGSVKWMAVSVKNWRGDVLRMRARFLSLRPPTGALRCSAGNRIGPCEIRLAPTNGMHTMTGGPINGFPTAKLFVLVLPEGAL